MYMHRFLSGKCINAHMQEVGPVHLVAIFPNPVTHFSNVHWHP
jgi:hypothetical protein